MFIFEFGSPFLIRYILKERVFSVGIYKEHAPYSLMIIDFWEGFIVEFSFGLILSIVIAIFLAIDAPKHERSPWVWGILGFLFGPIVLGIYLIVTDRKVAGWIILGVCILLILLFILLFGVGMFFIFSGA